ncbi:type I secretion system permease/ATPase [Verminephrobacter eiseniae]|uniref:type I secretion system permease/ATPase n=2 Tax=Verminephrobacter eiseniae TaxID=364317 RepID=UPI0022373AF8|nr:type I secretion system permease/ATPase [Verminephrobacter eiseniae]MCW5234400.1 type I secretion system permease/ATPase [Verminephrobacter eiseniae]MCW5294024.1 type I secretion system permease/ATPase [Verminephrobacter eiseniae]MCW8183238.1 type I secretion system permease/ATPase [Verminephrobacter eiseniae]MCW8232773.1 type I secretion system permease/ATPase [Verminephrobacter eiseniae]
MPVPAAPSELRQALAKLTPFFWRAFVFAIIGGLLVLGPTVYMFEVYDRVVNSRNELTLAMLTLIVLLAIVVMELLEWARAETLREAGAALDQALAPRIFNAIHVAHLKQGAALGVQPMVDLRVVRDFFHGPALGAAMEAPVALILLILLFVIHPLLGWVALAGAVLQTGVSWLNERSTSPVMLEANRSDMGAKTYVDGTLRHSDVVAALGMEQDMRRRWLRLYDEGLGLQSRASDRAAVFQSIGKFFQTTLASALLGLGAWLLLRNQLPGGPGMMIVGSVLGGRVLAPLVQVVSQWRAVIQLRGAWERLGQLLERQPAPTPNMPLPRPQARVAVENLVAGASAGAAPFIRGLSFQLTPGEVLGVLGSSACGKTTLARILMGLWPPLAGSVRLDGVDVSIWDKAELGPHVGYVPQEVDLIDGTLGENIVRFGAIDGQAMYDAAQVVGLHAWITSLPLGYDTPVGEAGVMLSGGQRQRVALARAFYGSPVFVVLDEPNASLDEAGNIALAEALRTFKARGTTIVVMTHLQSVLAVTDKLLVLHAGMQQAFGPRDEVLAMLQGRSAAVASAASTGSVVTVEAQAS